MNRGIVNLGVDYTAKMTISSTGATFYLDGSLLCSVNYDSSQLQFLSTHQTVREFGFKSLDGKGRSMVSNF